MKNRNCHQHWFYASQADVLKMSIGECFSIIPDRKNIIER